MEVNISGHVPLFFFLWSTLVTNQIGCVYQLALNYLNLRNQQNNPAEWFLSKLHQVISISYKYLLSVGSFLYACLVLAYHSWKELTEIKKCNNYINERETLLEKLGTIAVGNYLFKVNNRNTRASCEIWSKLTLKTPEAFLWCFYC